MQFYSFRQEKYVLHVEIELSIKEKHVVIIAYGGWVPNKMFNLYIFNEQTLLLKAKPIR